MMALTVLQEYQVKRGSRVTLEDLDFQDWRERKERGGLEGTKVIQGKRERQEVMLWVYQDHQDLPGLQGRSSTSRNF